MSEVWLPDEMWMLILNYFQPFERINLGLISKQHQRVLYNYFSGKLKNGYKINPFQQEMLSHARKAIPDKTTVFQYDISSGKSVAAALVARLWSPSIIVTTPNLFLHLRDTIEKFFNCKYFMLRSDVCKNIKQTVNNLDLKATPLIVVTTRTLSNLNEIADKFQAIVIDEYHIACESQTLRNFLSKTKDIYRIGLSASKLKKSRRINVVSISSDYTVKYPSALVVTPVICYIPPVSNMEGKLFKKLGKYAWYNSFGNYSIPDCGVSKKKMRKSLKQFTKTTPFNPTLLISELMLHHRKLLVFQKDTKRVTKSYLKLVDQYLPGTYNEVKEFVIVDGDWSIADSYSNHTQVGESEFMLLSSKITLKKRKQLIDNAYSSDNQVVLFAPLTFVKVGLDFAFASAVVIIGEFTTQELRQICGRILRTNNMNKEVQIFWVRTYIEGRSIEKLEKRLQEEIFPNSEVTDALVMRWRESDCVIDEKK